MTNHNEDNQFNGDNENSDSNDKEIVTERIDKLRRTEQQRLLTEIAQSAQDTSDELRLMNENIENLTHEVRATKEAIKSITEALRKYLDKKLE
jgi:ABC-type transporter Mla subunit MlaD